MSTHTYTERRLADRARAAAGEDLALRNQANEKRIAELTAANGELVTDCRKARDAGDGLRGELAARDKEDSLIERTQRVEAIGALANGIAHDLNNALAPVLIAVELLRTGCPDPLQQRLLETIRTSTERCADMVKQIRTFAHGAEDDRGIVQVRHLLKELINISRETFPKGIKIAVKMEGEIWALVGNPTQLHQVLLNLSVNARDAMPHGGTLTFAAANVRLGEHTAVPFAGAHAGPHVVLTVRDTGCGMTPEVREKIFDPFFTTKPCDKGTGLGLSTVQSIVRAHGGFVTVKTTVGVGSEFQVWLPALPTAVLPTIAARVAPPMGHGEWIMVVDDEAAIRSIAGQVLKLSGYNVMPAEDGAHAVALCAQHRDKLRVVITDMAMPVMDGPTAIRAIRRIAPHVRIIAASGMDEASRAISEAQVGVHGFLHKPYGADQLLQTIHDVLLAGDEASLPVFVNSEHPAFSTAPRRE